MVPGTLTSVHKHYYEYIIREVNDVLERYKCTEMVSGVAINAREPTPSTHLQLVEVGELTVHLVLLREDTQAHRTRIRQFSFLSSIMFSEFTI